MTEQAWHRRHAIQIAAQLPEDPEDAKIVLECLGRLVGEYLAPGASPATPTCGTVLSLHRRREPGC